MLGSLIASWFSPATPPQEEPKFPVAEIADLNGRVLKFPAQLPGKRTIVLVAFTQDQQNAVDTWVDGMKLKEPDAMPWIELPTVANLGQGFRVFLDGAMKSGITKTEDRARVFTYYTNVGKFVSNLKLAGTKQIYAMVVDRDGTIHRVEPGRYSQEGAARLSKAMTVPQG